VTIKKDRFAGVELRRKAKEIARGKIAQLSENLEAMPPEETRKILHEMEVRCIDLEMQNEELRRAQVELEKSRARYFDLYDLAPVGYVTVSENGLILEANLTVAILLGLDRSALIKKPITRFVFPEDQDHHYLNFKQLFKAGVPQVYELRMLRRGGATFWVQLAEIMVQDAEGAPACRIAISDITARKIAENAIQASLKEKEILLREVNHRVKNNLQIINGLYNLQAEKIRDKEVKNIFKESQARVKAISLVHEKLYQARDLSKINMEEYVKSLVQSIQHLFAFDMRKISVDINVENNINIGIDLIVNCGLIINELATNAFKYAFPDGRIGVISIGLRKSADGEYVLTVSDNGVGMPKGFNIAASKTLGLELVWLLANQMGSL